MVEKIKSARRCGVPIVMVGTSDQRATMADIIAVANGSSPAISYNIVDGMKAINQQGQTAISEILDGQDPVLFTNPVAAIQAATALAPDKTIIVCLGSQRMLTDASVQQAICNWRDPAKGRGLMLVLLTPLGGAQLPADLAADVLTFDDTPPDDGKRAEIITELHKAAELDEPKPDIVKEAVAATKGLSSYAAEQAVALSIRKTGLDQKELWQRWRQAINSTPGLTVDESGSTLADVGGLENLKGFSRKIMDGRRKPSAVIRIEEIEKALSGTGFGNSGVGDSSGTSQGLLGALLTHMQETNASGLIAVGPPGSGKSLASVALGSAGNVPTITLDLGALKGSLVGQTEQNTRAALATLTSLVGERAFWVGTCNSMASLPPELRRRFRYGIWYFDLPNAEERKAIWKIWQSKYKDVKGKLPNDEGWTGAEIKTAMELAYDLDCSPAEAAKWIVPVSTMARETIDGLRKQASGRYLSASYEGTYKIPMQNETGKGRRMEV